MEDEITLKIINDNTPLNLTSKSNIIKGIDGINGKSAYEIAVDEGFIGTKEEWLSSLKGDPAITDQTYTPDSENAQSGKAVSQAVANKQDTLIAGTGISIGNNVISVSGDGNFELIESITVGEGGVDEIIRKDEPNGNQYNFKKIIIEVKKLQAEISGIYNCCIYTNRNGTSSTGVYFSLSSKNAGTYGAAYITAVVENGVMQVSFNEVTGGNSSYKTPTNSSYFPAWAINIPKIAFYKTGSSPLIPEGTIFNIYGVRAQ